MSSLNIFIEGQPVPQGRPKFRRAGNFVQTYTPAASKDYREYLQRHIVAVLPVDFEPFVCPLMLELYFQLSIPQSWSGKKKNKALSGEILPVSKFDPDNLAKAVMDAGNELLWKDDGLIVNLYVEKRYAETPGVRIIAIPWLVNEVNPVCK